MQTDYCWNYFCASKGDIIAEELYGSSNYEKLKEKTAFHEHFSLQNRKRYINTLPSATVLFSEYTIYCSLFRLPADFF